MKRNVILAVVVVAALAIAGMGGLFADFSDIEVSEDNYFATGSLDLLVSTADGTHYNGEAVPAILQYDDAWPCCTKDYYFDLENMGQGDQYKPYLYIHLKNFECGWVMPKAAAVYKWIACDPETGECREVPAPSPLPQTGEHGTGFPKPVTEPEYVAECGGIAGEDQYGNFVEVDGIGCCYGDGCQLAEHVDLAILIAGPYHEDNKPAKVDDVPVADWHVLDISAYDTNGDGVVKLNELECVSLELGQLDQNHGIWVDFRLHLQEPSEEDFNLDYFDESIPAEAKWNDWPTNALQKDYLEFDMSFELLQYRYVPA